MLTLATNVFPCRVNPAHEACMTGLHEPQIPLDIPDFGSSQVSMNGHGPVGYFGHFNQGFSNCQRGHNFPISPYPGNVGPTPAIVSPAAPPTRPAIHIYPTFVNVTNVHNTQCHLHPTAATHPDYMKHGGQHALTSEYIRLPTAPMFTTAPPPHNICPANNNKCCNRMDCSHKRGLEHRSKQDAPSINHYQSYSVQIVKNKGDIKCFDSTQWIKREDKTKGDSLHCCQKFQGAASTDIRHSIASILSSHSGVTNGRYGSVGTSPSPSEQPSCEAVAGESTRESPERDDGDCLDESGSDVSVDGSDDDIGDVDVTSCSGDENDESVSSSSSSSVSDRGVDDDALMCTTTNENYRMHDTHLHTKSHVLASRSWADKQKANEKNIRIKYANSQKDTNNKSALENNSTATADTVSHVSNESHSSLNNLDNSCLKTEESNIAQQSKLGASVNYVTKMLPPIESLRHPIGRSNDESPGGSAFKPIAKTWAGSEKRWTGKTECRSRNREFPNFYKQGVYNDKDLQAQWRTLPMSLHNVKHRMKDDIHSQRRHAGGDSYNPDAIDMLRHRSFLYQKQGIPDRLFHMAGNLPHSLGAWFRWLRHGEPQSRQPVTSHAETPLAARCPPPPPRYYCEACNKTYSTFGGLSKHRQFHCAEHVRKEFACNVCSKSYSSLGALKMHIRTHTLPCKCHVCGKAFSRPWLLQGHVRTHTGEKPFRCSHCGRAFADRSNLRAHLQTHAEIKKYACRKCGKTFSRMSLLTKHSDGSCPENSKSIPRDNL